MKIDSTVKKETVFIATSVVIMSMLMEAVFLVLRKWELSVLLGNLLGGTAAVLNFFLMGITLQKALGKDPKDAGTMMKFSQTYRMLMLLAVAGIGVLVPVFNAVATILPLFFPRIAIAGRVFTDSRKNRLRNESVEEASDE
ncbi:MAG: hypothetical protein IKN14_08865 [Clostridiales bacterium]|nr:hypothetical protein [Clostridiales bacterium]